MTTSDRPAPPAVLNARQVAAECAVNERTVRRWVTSGILKADRIGRTFRISRDDLTTFLRADRTVTAGPSGQNGQVSEQSAELPAEQDRAGNSGTDIGPSDLSQALRLLDKLQQQNLELAGRVGYLQAELAASREQVRALMAPSQAREPWWRRLFAP